MSGAARSLSVQWNAAKASLREALDPDEAMAWLPGLRLAHLSRDRAVFAGVPNAFFQQRILRQFSPLIRRSLAGAFADWELAADLELELRIGSGEEGADAPPAAGSGDRVQSSTSAESATQAALREAHLAGQLTLFPEDAPPMDAGSPAPGHALGGVLSFAAFQVGEENRVAALLAHDVATQPETLSGPDGPRPFYLAGPSGAGKSHLLRAIAEAWQARHPGWRVVRRSAEQFTVDVLDGIRRKRMPAVRELYRGADALLLDDVGFLEVSAKAQEELLHTYEALQGAGKPMVLAADRAPSALQGLSEALRSRLESALVAELGRPGEGTRLAILRAGTARAGLEIGEEALRFLAARITGSARKLEGVLARLTAHASMWRAPLDVPSVRDLAAPWLEPEPQPGLLLPPARVLGIVCEEFGLSPRVLRGRERSRQRDLARQMAMKLLREQSGLSSGEIGRWLGNRAHSTVVEAIASLEKKLSRDDRLRDTWALLEKRLDAVQLGAG